MFEPPIDILASVSYLIVTGLELGIFLLVPIVNPRAKLRQRLEAERRGLTPPTGLEDPRAILGPVSDSRDSSNEADKELNDIETVVPNH